MHIVPTSRRARRSRLLAGATIALTALLAMPSSAQTVDATALRSAINRQSAGSGVSADATGASAAASSQSLQTTTASVADNQIFAAARANSATTSLDPAAFPSDAGASPTTLSIDGNAISGQADNLLVNSQNMTFAPASATLLAGRAGITAADVSGGDLSVAGNDLEASALGNQAVDHIGLDNVLQGAGRISAQTGDAASSVSANNSGVTQLAIASASGSNLDLSGNTSLARAGGNVVSDTLSASGTSLVAPNTSSLASTVSAVADDTNVANALYTSLGRQQFAGTVTATAGSAPANFSVAVSGDLDASSASAGNNMLGAVTNGNQSSRSLALTAGSIAAADDAGATIANVTGVQRVIGGGVSATANGGTTISVGGSVHGSELSASQNVVRAAATGNRADGNLLTVGADAVDTGQAARGGGLAVGTDSNAITSDDGVSSTTAAFSVQNVQQVDAGVSAGVTGGSTMLALAGPVDHADLAVSANATSAAATGNSATNGVALQADALRSSIDLNNAQTVDGTIRSAVGTSGDRAGAKIEPVSSVSGSQLRVTNNSVTGSAVASSTSNSVTIGANSISDGSGHVDAKAGQVDGGYGAAADVALASYQKFGTPLTTGHAASSVISNVTGKFAIGGAAYTNASTLVLDDNSQAATAVANTVLDRLSLTATSVPGISSPAAGTALSSSQFGDGSVGANSDMLVIARGGVGNSAVSMSDNSNQAAAVMNDADNGLTVSAGLLDGVTGGPASVDAGSLGSASITGDHVLSGTQFASGIVGAAAQTRLINSDAGAAMTGSTFDLSGNSTLADVSANRAVNAVSVSSITGMGADAGLANSQMSAATVNATARTDATLGLADTPARNAIYGSSATISDNVTQAVARGNSADNALTLNGPASGPMADAGAARVGSFDAIATAPALLVNVQSNYGSVTAGAAGTIGVPLNAAGSVASSTLSVSGNAMTASAYGNAATNQVTIGGLGGAPGAVLSNVQTNSGPVSASVAGGNFAVRGAQLSNSAMTMSGNALAASATGNIATSAITAGH